jgi:hypothetical protein
MAQNKEASAGKPKVQGEGDYESARIYRKDVQDFIADQKENIPGMAKKAEAARETPERADLDAAEEKGKSKARH